MARRSSGSGFTLSWPFIIGCIFVYNVLFDDDKKEETEIKVSVAQHEEVKPVDIQSPDLEEKLKEVGGKLKEVGGGLKNAGENIVIIIKEEIDKERENDQAQNVKKDKEEIIEEREEVVESPEPSEPSETKEEITGMKKL